MLKSNRLIGFLLVSITLLISCARTPPKDSGEALRISKDRPILSDDGDLLVFAKALKENIPKLKASNRVSDPVVMGSFSYTIDQFFTGMEHFTQLIFEHHDDLKTLYEKIEHDFYFLDVYGQDNWGEAFMTSYYEPILFGSMKPNAVNSQALYRKPSDLVYLEIEAYKESYPHLESFKTELSEMSQEGLLRGRLIDGNKIIPFFNRQEIDGEGALKQRNLELAYVSPLDAYFLQIQGSGTVKFENGSELRLGYSDQNGFYFVPIGKFLKDIIPKEEMGLRAIKQHLLSLNVQDRNEFLFKDPSYVFFAPLGSSAPVTYSGTEVIEGRTIATDRKLFPKGAIAFLEFKKPEFDASDDITPREHVETSRFVWDQDTGGAIRGGHRLDLFWGKGKAAEQAAGSIQQWVKLKYLAPKPHIFQTYAKKLTMGEENVENKEQKSLEEE